MKITEKQWLEQLRIEKSKFNPELIDSFIISRIAENLFHEAVFTVGFNNKRFYAKNEIAFKNYIFEDFAKKYDLIPGSNVICGKNTTCLFQDSSLYGGGDDSNLVVSPIMLFGEDLIIPLIVINGTIKIYGIVYRINKVTEVLNMIKDYQNFIENLPKSPDSFGINHVSQTNYGLGAANYEIKHKNSICIDEIYNEDLPDEKIIQFIKSDEKGIVILHGIPGCGKTTYIESIIERCNDRNIEYYLLTIDLFGNMDNLRKFILQRSNEHAIYIIEDCEELLRPRSNMSGSTAALSDLLNFADGIFGNITNAKFILTFNTNISKVDEAILRKKRLRVKYEFKPLRGERLKKLAEKNGFEPTPEEVVTGLPLSEIFGRDEESYTIKEKKIGYR